MINLACLPFLMSAMSCVKVVSPADGAETTVGGHWNVFHSTCIKFALLAAQRCRLFP